MKKMMFSTALAAAVAVGALAPTVSFAANARHPYKNVNKANDKGNNTGDEAVARLNQQQLDQARAGR